MQGDSYFEGSTSTGHFFVFLGAVLETFLVFSCPWVLIWRFFALFVSLDALAKVLWPFYRPWAPFKRFCGLFCNFGHCFKGFLAIIIALNAFERLSGRLLVSGRHFDYFLLIFLSLNAVSKALDAVLKAPWPMSRPVSKIFWTFLVSERHFEDFLLILRLWTLFQMLPNQFCVTGHCVDGPVALFASLVLIILYLSKILPRLAPFKDI